jgi:hypothetical protein
MARMTCGQFLETIRREAPFYEELFQHQAIRPWVNGDELRVDLDSAQLSPATKNWLRPPSTLKYRTLIHHWLIADAIAKGPKVFRPSLMECLALEQFEARLSVADYVQPYPVMLLDLPEAYQERRVCPPFATSPLSSWGAPTCVLIGTPPPVGKAIWLSFIFSSGSTFQLAMIPTDETIEAGILREFGEDSYVPADPITLSREQILASLVRVAVSAMLGMVNYGCSAQGPANPSHYQRLEHYLQLARKKQRGISEAERNLRLAMQLYGLPQDIKLYRTARSKPRTTANGDSGETRRPHWRHGYSKMVPYGPGRSLRKLWFIEPVMVNGHLLFEGAKIPQTRYRSGS